VEDTLKEALFIGLAGALGSLARWGIGEGSKHLLGANFPWGTLTVNFLGSILLGMLLEGGLRSDGVPDAIRIPVAVGFFGAFTTFSTFSVDTVRLLEASRYGAALGNMLANVGLGVGGALAGILLIRKLLGG
jgi:CrcB protein